MGYTRHRLARFYEFATTGRKAAEKTKGLTRTSANAPETIFSMSGMTAKRDTCHRIIRYGRTLGFGHNCKPCLRNGQLKRWIGRRDSNPLDTVTLSWC